VAHELAISLQMTIGKYWLDKTKTFSLTQNAFQEVTAVQLIDSLTN